MYEHSNPNGAKWLPEELWELRKQFTVLAQLSSAWPLPPVL